MSRATVVAVSCETYEQNEVETAVNRGIELLGIAEKLKGRTFLVKPNCLSPKSPSSCVTTHPEIVRAVVRVLKNAHRHLMIGDQPGGGHGERAIEVSGMRRVAEEEGVTITTFEREGYKRVKLSSLLRDGYFAKTYLSADMVVSLPKLKTHSQTMFTGAVKNVFGAVPLKTRRLAHSLAQLLPRAIVDIYAFRPPDLNIMDAVWGMEGDGPSQGTPRHLGLILLSEDAVALDAVASHLIGIDPMDVQTTRIAHERGIGIGDLGEIDVVGEEIESYRRKFRPPKNFFMKNPKVFSWLLYSLSSVRPRLDKRNCHRCEDCVHICSMDAITMNPYPVIDYRKCIECFSCSEVCERDAIKPKRVLHIPILSKLVRV
ncbi:hypothetical protein AMJ40_03710 [candidate division TA06 bacterium DG_26]|uniref:4Fe-4S ferredoxin-type domain-containing protein n=1 Tax=candidate division TA06 bacterium DG_26 TaxID=1703771 RepID=A0A0S7WIZ9_UNCT6|nr:MAG: hypothetical protein AMJ40_03710 [candidate division TA06 bacterium DG_26]